MKKRISLFLVVVLMLTTIVPVQKIEAKKKIKLNKTKMTMYVGDQKKLSLKGSKGIIKWSSSNKKVASVNFLGYVTAKKKGSATITAKYKKKKYKCKITVKPYATIKIQPNLPSIFYTYEKDYDFYEDAYINKVLCVLNIQKKDISCKIEYGRLEIKAKAYCEDMNYDGATISYKLIDDNGITVSSGTLSSDYGITQGETVFLSTYVYDITKGGKYTLYLYDYTY